jgi:FixJ family two-component response regulator
MVTEAPLIAIVDDDQPTLKALARLLRVLGFEVATFSGGRDFLGAVRDHPPHCAVVDLQMPDVNGLEVLRALNLAMNPVPAIVMTAHDELGLRAACLAAGARAYLSKPVDAGTLQAAIADALRGTKVQLPDDPAL